MIWRLSIPALVLLTFSGCGPSYSPDTYSANAVQQANKVEQGIVVGVRNVGVSASGTIGSVTGAAAGGIGGSQVASGPVSAISALGGSLVGGLAGSAVEHATSDTAAFEYIIRKSNGDLVSVTQKDKTPLALGQRVLVIAGNQARVVPDYTVNTAAPPAKAEGSAKPPATETRPQEAKPADPAAAEGQSQATPPAAQQPVGPPPTGGSATTSSAVTGSAGAGPTVPGSAVMGSSGAGSGGAGSAGQPGGGSAPPGASAGTQPGASQSSGTQSAAAGAAQASGAPASPGQASSAPGSGGTTTQPPAQATAAPSTASAKAADTLKP